MAVGGHKSLHAQISVLAYFSKVVLFFFFCFKYPQPLELFPYNYRKWCPGWHVAGCCCCWKFLAKIHGYNFRRCGEEGRRCQTKGKQCDIFVLDLAELYFFTWLDLDRDCGRHITGLWVALSWGAKGSPGPGAERGWRVWDKDPAAMPGCHQIQCQDQ